MEVLIKLDYGFRMKYLTRIIERYHKLDKKGKKIILDEAVKVLGYNRKYLITLLNSPFDENKGKGIIIGRGRKKVYDTKIRQIIIDLYHETSYPWSCRLKKIIIDWEEHIKRKYKLNEEEYKKLKRISASTLDRILKDERMNIRKRLYGRTKPGKLLKHEIPIFCESYTIKEAGHFEIDLVAHCGQSASDEFIWTVNMVDIYTQYCESRAIMGKGEYEVINAIDDIINNLAFKIKTIDCDNGSELNLLCRFNNLRIIYSNF